MGQYNVVEALVKKPGAEKPRTKEEDEEWIKCAADPFYFMTTYCKVVTPKGRKLYEPRIYQEDMIKLICDEQMTCINAPRQCGKALALDTVVPTPTGYTTMGDIVPGDFVIGDDGKPTQVIGVSPVMYDHTCYRVRFSTGEEVIADAEHLWTVNKIWSNRKHTLTTQQLLDAGVLVGKKNEARFSIDTMSAFESVDENLPIDPYVLGYWLGDGTSRVGAITVHRDDLSELLVNIEKANLVVSRVSEYRPGVMNVAIEGLTSALGALNLRQNKHIPVQYLRASRESRIALLQGILDSDGYVSADKGRIELIQKSKTLIDDIHELISSLGVRCSLPSTKTITQFDESGVDYYRIHVSIFSSDFQPFRLERKRIKVRENPAESRKYSTKKRQIVAIEPVASVPVRCIKVDNESSLFCVTRSFIPTHNTISLGLYALHQAIFTDDFTVGFTSFKTTNCKDFLARVKTAYEELPDFLKPAVTLYNRTEVAFAHGSQIYVQVTSENALRGRTNQLAIIDEFAFVSPLVAEEFYTALLPSLTADGEESTTKAIFISTPRGTVGKYAELAFGAMAKRNGFAYMKVDYKLIPGRTEEFKKKMLGKMSKEKYHQEYEGAFVSDSPLLINSSILEALPSKEPVRTFRTFFDIYVESFKGRRIAFACDVAEGISKDNHAIQAVDVETFEQVAEFSNNTLNQTMYFKEIVAFIEHLFDEGAVDVYYTVEANSIGQGIIRLIENSTNDALQNAIMISDINKDGTITRLGTYTTNPKKMTGCMSLKDLVETNRMTLHSIKVLTELKFFIKQGAGFAAEKGAKDDLVMALVLLMNMLPQLANFDDDVYDRVNNIDEVNMDDEVWGISF